jgi:hypothetical protein
MKRSSNPADGERGAIIGYRAQYLLAAVVAQAACSGGCRPGGRQRCLRSQRFSEGPQQGYKRKKAASSLKVSGLKRGTLARQKWYLSII